jgi:hypothetical protein
MFKQESTACLHALLKNCVMHETAARLNDALRKVAGIDGLTDPKLAAAYLNESQQTFTNWRARGVSQAGMLTACSKMDLRARWMTSGDGEMLSAVANATPIEMKTVGDAMSLLAQVLSTQNEGKRAVASSILANLALHPEQAADFIGSLEGLLGGVNEGMEIRRQSNGR